MELLEFAGKVALAGLLGTLIGLERQFRQHPAGLRTNALVSLGAALFVSLTDLLGDINSRTRIAAYIVSGVGFLGGGVILKEGINVRGLTTAAGLWCSAAVGTLAGTGHGLHAAIGTVFVLGVLEGLRPLVNWLDQRQRQLTGGTGEYRVRVLCRRDDSAAVRTVLARHLGAIPGIVITGVTSSKPKQRKQVAVTAEVVTTPVNDKAIQDVISRLLIEPGVRSASWEKVARIPE